MLTFLKANMIKRPMVRCKELGMHCVTVRDGYYILGPVCVGVGLLILVGQYFIFDWLCHIVMIWDHLYEWLCLIAMFIIALHIGHIIDCVCVSSSLSLQNAIFDDRVFTVLQLTLGQEQEQNWTNCRYGCGEQRHSCNVNQERLGGWSPSRTPPQHPRTPLPPAPPCRRARQPV